MIYAAGYRVEKQHKVFWYDSTRKIELQTIGIYRTFKEANKVCGAWNRKVAEGRRK